MTDALMAIPEDWSTATAVVAHPDDLEYGTAAAVARWTSQGKRIGYCLVTSGEAGIDAVPPEEAGPLREAEQRAAAALVGVDAVEFLGHPDGMVEHTLRLRRDLARVLRRSRPDVVVTANFRERWPTGGLNQADHVAVGRAVVDAIRDAGNRWVFRELLEEGLEPWNGVRMLLAVASPSAEHAVDVTEHFGAGVRSLQAHATYLAGLGPGPMADPAAFLDRLSSAAGSRLGTRYAVPFELFSV